MTEDERQGEGPAIAITYPYPFGMVSGGTRMTREIAIHLSRAGADVTVLPVSTNSLSRRFPRQPPRKELLGEDQDEELEREGVRIARVPQHPMLLNLDGLQVKRTLKRLMREKPLDAVLSYYHEGGFLPSFLRRHGVHFGYIATWQSYDQARWREVERIPHWKKRWRTRALAWLNERTVLRPYRRAEILFATSEHTRRELTDFIGVEPDRVVITPLGVAPHFFEVEREERPDVTRLLFFGRISRDKGFMEAIAALGQLKRRGVTGWRYRLVGDGRPEWAREAARDHGVEEEVEVKPFTDDEGVKRELAWADIAIMPSHSESFGLAFAEAQASGLPVVAYRAGSVPEIVEDGVTGWLAPLHDTDELAALVERAIRNPAETRRAGEAARVRMRDRFTWDRTAATILEGLRSLS